MSLFLSCCCRRKNFADWCACCFHCTPKRIQKLWDIFHRLSLAPLNERFKKLEDLVDRLENISKSISSNQQNNSNNNNNPPPPPPPPPPVSGPDLAMTGFFAVMLDNYTNFTITVQNVGKSISSTANVGISGVGGAAVSGSASVPPLSPGESFTTNIQYSFDPQGEIKDISAIATVGGGGDTNADNNSLLCSAQIRSPYPPDAHAYLILHMHGPEGKELNGITVTDYYGTHTLIDYAYANIFNGIYFLGAWQGVTTQAQHGVPIQVNIPAGTYTMSGYYNGLILQQQVTFEPGKIAVVVFSFPRTTMDIDWNDEATATLSEAGGVISNPDATNVTKTLVAASVGAGCMTEEYVIWGTNPLQWWTAQQHFDAGGGASISFNKSSFSAHGSVQSSFSESAPPSPPWQHWNGFGINSLNTSVGLIFEKNDIVRNPTYPYKVPALDIDIPIQVFNSWVVQGQVLGTYPGIYLASSGQNNYPIQYGWSRFIDGGYRSPLKYFAMALSAKNHYQGLGAYSVGSENGYGASWYEEDIEDYSAHSTSFSESGQLLNLRMSSVPFDDNNTSF